jgi:creatinine amidohydrolase/Fe(II)-dependent formamide hydrolase-like protein
MREGAINNGIPMRLLNWHELGWRDFAARDMFRTVAVLPIAAIEQHGPHLPVGVDIGKSNEHLR